MSHDIDIEAIFENDPATRPPLMRVVVADLDADSRRDINKIFKLTKDLTPPEGLKHLRRVRDTEDNRIECIVCKVIDNPDGSRPPKNSQDFINEARDTLESNGVVLKDYRIVEVPSRSAKTKAQLDDSSKFWPTKFSKSEYLIKCMDGSMVDVTERLVVKLIINRLLSHLAGCKFTSGAVIFRYAKIYGVGLSCCDLIRSNPTKHAPMLAIDAVAKNAGAGHWPEEAHSSGDNLCNELQNILDNRLELNDHKMEPDFLPYICTNYDIVITVEPCMMCTMGLIQSRIRRVFYLKPANQELALKQTCYPDRAIEEFYIHRDKNINHRFEAWRIKLLPGTGAL